MSIPNTPGKLDGRAVIEPSGVIEERRKIGLHPSGAVPDGAIICYDAALWKWISSLPEKSECDGWLKGSYLLPCKAALILVTKAAGFGAPTAVLSFEELVAYGIRKIINLGAAGGLQKDMKIGDIVVCESAVRDEGTSHHYLPDEKYAFASKDLTSLLCENIQSRNIKFMKGSSWTTDAIYRETLEELKSFRDEGILTVEMEASALFAVGTFRKVKVSSVFAISDILSEEGWKQGYHSEEKLEGLMQIFEAAAETLGILS